MLNTSYKAFYRNSKLSHGCPKDKKGQKNSVPRVSGAQTRDKIDSHNRKETSNKPP